MKRSDVYVGSVIYNFSVFDFKQMNEISVQGLVGSNEHRAVGSATNNKFASVKECMTGRFPVGPVGS